MYECYSIQWLVQVVDIVEFDSRIKQGALSTPKKHSGKYVCCNPNSLPLICVCRTIKHPMCIEEVEIVEVDDIFLLRQSSEAILIDKKIHILQPIEI